MLRRLVALSLVLLAACKENSLDPIPFIPGKGVVVLNGYTQQGLTLVPDTGNATDFRSLPATFDGGGLRITRDTVLTTSSKAGGDILYVTALPNGARRPIQMPAGSNPGGADLVAGRTEAQVVVALRDSQALALVTNLGNTTPTITLRRGIGLCPVDVYQLDGDILVLDSNLNCRTDFSVAGPSRLLRVRLGSTVIDTIPLPGVFGASNMQQRAGSLYIGGFGQVNFGTGVVTTPGTMTKFDLEGMRVVVTAPLPAGSFGTVAAPGRDGFIYAFAYANATTFPGRVVRMDSTSLSTVGPYLSSGGNFARLLAPDSSAANCSSATVDLRGRLYCTVVGAASASTLYVYNANYLLIRQLPVGQGAVAVQPR